MEILKKNKLIEKKYSVNYKYVDISVSLERGREDGEGDTFFIERLCHITCVTVFQPTEIRTNTGSVSYPKVKRENKNLPESQDKSQGI